MGAASTYPVQKPLVSLHAVLFGILFGSCFGALLEYILGRLSSGNVFFNSVVSWGLCTSGVTIAFAVTVHTVSSFRATDHLFGGSPPVSGVLLMLLAAGLVSAGGMATFDYPLASAPLRLSTIFSSMFVCTGLVALALVAAAELACRRGDCGGPIWHLSRWSGQSLIFSPTLLQHCLFFAILSGGSSGIMFTAAERHPGAAAAAAAAAVGGQAVWSMVLGAFWGLVTSAVLTASHSSEQNKEVDMECLSYWADRGTPYGHDGL